MRKNNIMPIFLHNYTIVFATAFGIWNLDFFRMLIPPICLPLTAMQVIALDYLVAAYPLLLLVCFYVLVTAHDRGCRLVVRLWRPFLWCSARIRQQWNIRHSIIDAFATFLLLSYIKFLSVSGDLLLTTPVFNIHGSRIGHFMYYDGTVEFMGPQHMPYFIIAIIIFVIAIMFPLLLILYPMKWFQVFLNKCHLNSPGLRMFMECFQGYYRDRSDGGWECRYFSALFPILRICGAAVYNLTQSEMCYPLLIFIAIYCSYVFHSTNQSLQETVQVLRKNRSAIHIILHCNLHQFLHNSTFLWLGWNKTKIWLCVCCSIITCSFSLSDCIGLEKHGTKHYEGMLYPTISTLGVAVESKTTARLG